MKRKTKILLYIAILLTPLFGISEFLTLLEVNSSLKFLEKLKIIKDIIFVIFSLSAIIGVFTSKNKVGLYYFLFLIFLFIIGLLNIFIIGEYKFLIGFRTFLPFVIVLYSILYLNYDDLIDLERYVFIIQILLFCVILFEYFFTNTWGVGPLGFNKRACGFFFTPSPAASFVIISYIMHVELNKMTKINLVIYKFIVMIEIVLISSAMGFVVFLFVLVAQIMKKDSLIFLLSLSIPLIILFLILIYPVISGREDFFVSFLTRFNLIITSIAEGKLTGVAPGYGSNFFRVIFKDSVAISLPQLNDSLYASLFWQYGAIVILGFLIICLKYFYSAFYIIYKDKKFNFTITFLLGVMLSSFSVPINEFYPLNLLVPLSLGVIMKKSI